MQKEHFTDEHEMRQLSHDLYEKLRQARRMLIRMDIQKDKTNRVLYKAAIQWIDSAIDQLTFTD